MRGEIRGMMDLEEYDFFVCSEKRAEENVGRRVKEKGQVQDLPLHSGHDKILCCGMESLWILISVFNPHHRAAPLRVTPQLGHPSG